MIAPAILGVPRRFVLNQPIKQNSGFVRVRPVSESAEHFQVPPGNIASALGGAMGTNSKQWPQIAGGPIDSLLKEAFHQDIVKRKCVKIRQIAVARIVGLVGMALQPTCQPSNTLF
jgi:hypothetical protein